VSNITLSAEQLWAALPEGEKQRIIRVQIKSDILRIVRERLPAMVDRCIEGMHGDIDVAIRRAMAPKRQLYGEPGPSMVESLVNSSLNKLVGDAVRGSLKKAVIGVQITVADPIIAPEGAEEGEG
jgi:hypothetical protein